MLDRLFKITTAKKYEKRYKFNQKLRGRPFYYSKNMLLDFYIQYK